MDLKKLTITEARNMLDKKEISSQELFDAHKKEISKTKQLNAYINTFDYRENKNDGLLAGIPGVLKDNILVEGELCTAGSKILQNYRAVYDATAASRLTNAGATILGKGNMDEFAMGSTGEYSAFGPTLNPLDSSRVAGGSSSGPVAAVAAGSAMFGLGSETGGSIRLPAAWCGVVGVKPTYGRVSRHGLIAMASSLDQIGTVARTVKDAALALQVISGHDHMDSTSSDIEVGDFTTELGLPIKGLRVAVIKEFFTDGLDNQIKDSVEKALSVLESQGATIEHLSMSSVDAALATYYVIVPSEVSANLARYDGIRYGLSVDANDLSHVYTKSRAAGIGEEVRRRIMVGTHALSSGYYDAYYLKAQKVRSVIKDDFKRIFDNHDVIVGPTSAMLAPKLGELDNPLAVYLADTYMTQVNLAGLPAISVPYGEGEIDGKKLPVGVQIISRHFEEKTMFNVAYILEQSWKKQD